VKVLSLSQKNSGDFLGRKAHVEDYDLLIDEDAKVYKPDGALLCIVLKNKIDPSRAQPAWEVIERMNLATNNRGTAAGEGRRVEGKQTRAMTVESGILGYFERTPRFPYCRACAWNLDHPECWEKIIPLVQNVDELFKHHAPDRYEKQAQYIDKCHPDFLIKGTKFTTLTLNRNFRTAYHRDAGNLADGISCMTVQKKGQWSGANIVFPEFRVAAKLGHLDMIIFDPYEIHGNTPLIKMTKDATRVSIVYYFREHMVDCGSAEEELERVKHRKLGEHLIETKLRKK
jgi:hypothetical protein